MSKENLNKVLIVHVIRNLISQHFCYCIYIWPNYTRTTQKTAVQLTMCACPHTMRISLYMPSFWLPSQNNPVTIHILSPLLLLFFLAFFQDIVFIKAFCYRTYITYSFTMAWCFTYECWLQGLTNKYFMESFFSLSLLPLPLSYWVLKITKKKNCGK